MRIGHTVPCVGLPYVLAEWGLSLCEFASRCDGISTAGVDRSESGFGSFFTIRPSPRRSRSIRVVYRRFCFELVTALQTAPLDRAHSQRTGEACKRVLFKVGRWRRLNGEKGRYDIPTLRTGCRFECSYRMALLRWKSGPRHCDDAMGRREFAIGSSPSSMPLFETLAGERLKKGIPGGAESTSRVLVTASENGR
jgi:hypothetical protein